MPWNPAGSIRGPAVNTDPLYYDDFSTKPDGNLQGVVAASGQAWSITGVMRSWISNGLMGFDPSQASPNASAASYAYFVSTVGLDRIGARIVFENGTATGGSFAFGFFTDPNFSGTNNNSPAHLSVNPWGMELSVFTGGISNYTRLTPVGETVTFVEFADALVTDGVTEYDVEILLDRKNGQAFVFGPDRKVYMYRSDIIRTITGIIPFWEPFGDNTSNPIGRVRRIWADATPDTPRKQLPTKLQVARAGHKASSGAGSPVLRPSSRLVLPGSSWYDTVNNKVTWSDSSFWRDAAGQVAGNLFPHAYAKATKAASGYLASGNLTVTRASGVHQSMPSSYRLVPTATGLVGAYVSVSPFTSVVPGRTYSATVNKILSTVNARNCYVQITWYTAAFASLGSVISGLVNAPVNTPVATAIASGVAPANASLCAVTLYFQSTTTTDVFYATEFCLAPGTITGYLNT